MLPNFVIIGAQKSGTSSLYSYLNSHPQVFMSTPKEPQYFATERNWKMGQEWYESLFHDAGEATAVGEASTVYTKYPVHHGVPERMARLIPGARLIYLVRHPVERIRSHYEHLLQLNSESRPLAVAVLEDPKYVNYSSYAFQIEQYLKWFPRNQLLVATSEDLRNKRRNTLRRIFDFLGVDPTWVSPRVDVEHNRTRRLQPRSFARKLRRLPGYRRIARAAPPRVKSAYRRIARAPTYTWLATDANPEVENSLRVLASMPKDVRRELESRLSDDVARLRELLASQLDGWGIG